MKRREITKLLYVARYVPEDTPLFQDAPKNFSTTRKLEGFMACAKVGGYRTYVLATSAADWKAKETRVIRVAGNVVIVPKIIDFLGLRPVTYLLSIIYNTVLLIKLQRRIRASNIICWDYLPDTFLPALLACIQGRNHLIVDVEEWISEDPVATRFFRWFELLFKGVGSTQYFLASENLRRDLPPTASALVFNGFIATSVREEEQLRAKIFSKSFSDEMTVFFSGRIDDVRGAFEFIECAARFESESAIKFIMCGFGEEAILKKVTEKAPTNVEMHLEAPRATFLKHLFQSDIAFNMIQSSVFQTSSFPSKIIEYLAGANLVVSNHELEISSERLEIVSDVEQTVATIREYKEHTALRRHSHSPEKVWQEMAPFLISRNADRLRSFLNE